MLNTSQTDWESILEFGKLESGIELKDGEILFARIDEEKMAERIATDIAAKASAELLEETGETGWQFATAAGRANCLTALANCLTALGCLTF